MSSAIFSQISFQLLRFSENKQKKVHVYTRLTVLILVIQFGYLLQYAAYCLKYLSQGCKSLNAIVDYKKARAVPIAVPWICRKYSWLNVEYLFCDLGRGNSEQHKFNMVCAFLKSQNGVSNI